jgi:putative sigma-54 modulation protein
MKFDITGRHIDITPAIRAHVDTQFSKIEKAFEGKPAKAHLIIEVERGRHRSEVTVNWHNEALTATSEDSDMYHSISQTIGKIESQARKLKDRIIDKSHKAIKMTALTADTDGEGSIA